jgi:hypothetical protein
MALQDKGSARPARTATGSGHRAVEHVAGEPIPAPEVTPVPEPMTPVQETRSIRARLGGASDLLVYLVATVCAIVVPLVHEQGFDWSMIEVDRLGAGPRSPSSPLRRSRDCCASWHLW